MKDWALILGASSGIGAACAKALAKEGINGTVSGSQPAGNNRVGLRDLVSGLKGRHRRGQGRSILVERRQLVSVVSKTR